MPKYRMLHVDHYMSKPVSPFDDLKSDVTGKRTIKVPIIRIFGSDEGGNKICLHVHGFYPYIAIQDRDPQNPDLPQKIVQDIESAIKNTVEYNNNKNKNEGDNIQQLEEIQDEQQRLAARLHQERPQLKNLRGDQRFPIHRIERHKSFNYYGYHHEIEDFFKLHVYNPRMIKQLAVLFEDCKILGRFIPVFWAHLPYILLFFIDNNLRGMQFIEVDQLYWRKDKAPKSDTQLAYCSLQGSLLLEDDFISEIEQYTTDIESTSTCELEADIRFEWILNKQRFGSKGNDDALRELWLDDQAASQTSSTVDSRLPLYDLERCYIHQLCDSYEIDFTTLNLELTKRPSENMPKSPGCLFSDSDNSFDHFIDNDDKLTDTSSSTSSPSPSVANVVSDEKDVDKNKINLSQANKLSNLQVISPGNNNNLTRTSEIVSHEYQYLCLMSMELHISTRGKLLPDPAFDPIEAVFYCIRNDIPDSSSKPTQVIGMIITDPYGQHNNPGQQATGTVIESPSARSNKSYVAQNIRTLLHRTGLTLDNEKNGGLYIVDSELELIMTLVEIIKEHDPEILLGYEMEHLSWGYVLERATFLNISISGPLSRVIDTNLANNSKVVESTFVQPIMFAGRMVFSTWRIIRHDIHLNTCSYEKIHHYALNERVPCFTFQTLTKWFNENRNRWRVLDYYLVRVLGQMRILDKFDLMAKVSELARVYGTQFIDVITRGSQIGIESMMLRLAKLQNLTPLSPTVLQRNRMRAPEALPLVMEPETNIYYDPVAVLDFQSLYPSVVIAYNYCYSTCLGRVVDLETKERFTFGCSQLKIDVEEMKRLLSSNSVHISPCGIAFVKKNIRKGILPKMLSELILTRAMVKDQMKKNMRSGTPNRRLQRILDHRQHGLKMMANTTYGYTGASYTGRMPCVEIADSIVSKGRETLENAIELVESRKEWGAKVIYGDTDSIFIQFKNCDKDTAFKRAYEMVGAISAQNPYPIKMKFEKIYQPCVLQTKKRYCGFKYESPEQTRPEFEAKGIETVRRDCCPAAAKMLEMALRIQFTTRDVEQVKHYVQNQFMKIMSGKISNLQDFIFARQYKQRDFDKQESVFVPAWQITRRLLATDPRAEPRIGERVPFVIIYGEPKTPLVNLAKTPIEVLENLSFRINADYYIQKIICPTLNRIFCTLKQDTLIWYKSMPHQNVLHRSHHLISQLRQRSGNFFEAKQSTMLEFFSPSHCPVCTKSIPLNDEICDDCRDNLQSSVIRLSEEIAHNQRKLFAYHQLCRACSSIERSDLEDEDLHHNPCISYDCTNLFRYHQAKLDALNSNYLSQILKSLN